MHFTQEDYIKIENWLHRNSVKDTEFQEALPFTGKEIVTVVQDGHNRKVNIQEFINQLYKHGVEDFLNVTNTYKANNITLKEAIKLIPAEARKEGQVITFLNTDGNWEIYQFIGKLNQWNNPTLWNNPFDWEKLIVDSILPDEEDLTKSTPDANGNAYLSLKDRKYEPDKYSGLGRKILRRRVVEIEDPIYGIQEKNLLLQADFSEENTIYEIRYDFDFNNNTISIPKGCILSYQGGSLSNGIIYYSNTLIEGNEIIYNIKSTGNYDYIGGGLKDSVYNPEEFSGFGRKYLKKNITSGKNTLLQKELVSNNTIYVIKYDFDLNGEKVSIPENCILEFDGGSINNGQIIGNNTIISSKDVQIFDNITLNGTFKNRQFKVEWFGKLIQGVNTEEVATTNLSTIQNAIDNSVRTSVLNVLIGGKNDLNAITSNRIYINGTIIVPSMCTFGSKPRSEVDEEDNNTLLMIYQTANAPIIRIGGSDLSPSWCADWSYRICIHDIGLSTTVASDKNSLVYGITNNGVNQNVSHCTFESVYITQCRFGIYLYFSEGYSVGGSHNLFKRVSTKYNVVGCYLQGKSGVAPWFNYNTFDKCIFSFNYNVGLKIHEFGQQFDTNLLNNCIFEQNGRDYNYEDYLEFGCSGICCYTKKEAVLLVKDCYFEQNYASKRTADATPSDGEAWFDNSAYGETKSFGMTQNVQPAKVSELEGAIVAQFTTIDVSGCAIQGSHVFFQSWYDAVFYIHDNSYGSNVINEKTKDCLVYYNSYPNSTLYGAVRRLKINETYIPSSIKSPYSFKNYDNIATSVFGKFTVDISKNNIFEEEYLVEGKLTENSKIYYDTNNPNKNYKTLGTNPGISVIDRAIDSQLSYTDINTLKIVIVNCEALPKASRLVNLVSYGNVSFEGYKLDNSITTNWWLETLTKYSGKLTFNNLTLNQNSKTLLIRGDSEIEFNNCIIKIDYDGLLNFITGKSVVTFNNCTFINESGDSHFVIENYGNSAKLYLNNCNVPDNINVSVNPTSGTSEERTSILSRRRVEGQVFYDKDLHKPTYWNGTYWLDYGGNFAGIPTTGTFASKPLISSFNTPVGFKYFCTDRQTTEGATNGIVIYHKGNNVWVDALGRVVS